MIYEIYSIKDTCTGLLNEPKCFFNEPQAQRWFTQLCEKSEIKVDLQLFRLGTLDIKTGEIVSDCEFICAGVDNG